MLLQVVGNRLDPVCVPLQAVSPSIHPIGARLGIMDPWDESFDIFGIKRLTVASFEEPVKKLSGDWASHGCLWKDCLAS